MKTTFLYTLSDPRNGKIRYVGKSDNPDKRLSSHLRDRRLSHKRTWIDGLRQEGLVPTLDLLDEVPERDWEFWEQEYIRVFRAIGIRLVNMTDGGEGISLPGDKNPFYGKTHTAETREKIKAKRKLQVIPEEVYQKRSIKYSGGNNPFFGRRHSPETREKIRQKLLGRKVPPEALANRKSFAGENNPNFGRRMSQDQKEKIRISLLGRSWSPERREAWKKKKGLV